MKPVKHRMKKFLSVMVIVAVVCFGCVENPMDAAAQETAMPTKAKKPAISLTNYTNGTTIRYPVPLILGTLPDANIGNLGI